MKVEVGGFGFRVYGLLGGPGGGCQKKNCLMGVVGSPEKETERETRRKLKQHSSLHRYLIRTLLDPLKHHPNSET